MKKIITSLFVFLLFHISPVFAELDIDPNNPLNLSSSYTLNTDYESYWVLENWKITGFAVYRYYNGKLILYYKWPTHSTAYSEEWTMNFSYDDWNCSSYSWNANYRCLSKQYYWEILDARIVWEDLIVDMENALMRCHMYSYWKYWRVWTPHCTAIWYKEGARSIFGSTLAIMTDYKWLKLTNTASAWAIVLKISKSDWTESYLHLNKTYKMSSFTPDNSAVFEEIDYDFQKVKWNWESYTFEWVVKKYEQCKTTQFEEIYNSPKFILPHSISELDVNNHWDSKNYSINYSLSLDPVQREKDWLYINFKNTDNLESDELNSWVKWETESITFDSELKQAYRNPLIEITWNNFNLTFTGAKVYLNPDCDWIKDTNYQEILSGINYESKDDNATKMCVVVDVGIFWDFTITDFKWGFKKTRTTEKQVCENSEWKLFIDDILQEWKKYTDYEEWKVYKDSIVVSKEKIEKDLISEQLKNLKLWQISNSSSIDNLSKELWEILKYNDFIEFYDFTVPMTPNLLITVPVIESSKNSMVKPWYKVAQLQIIEDKLWVTQDMPDNQNWKAFFTIMAAVIYLFARFLLTWLIFSIFWLFNYVIDYIWKLFMWNAHYGAWNGNIWSLWFFMTYIITKMLLFAKLLFYILGASWIFNIVTNQMTSYVSFLVASFWDYELFANFVNHFSLSLATCAILSILVILSTKYIKFN